MTHCKSGQAVQHSDIAAPPEHQIKQVLTTSISVVQSAFTSK